MSKAPQIKNRAPAPIQITAEQLLRIAKNQGIEDVQKQPKQFITDKEELQQYQQTKRKDFEDQIRRQRQHIGIWCRYALWEAAQKEFERARSIFERSLDVDYRNQTLWLKYADMEMKNKFINHARNVWDRAVTLHPRVDTYWYKYSYMEEMVEAVDNARQIFERWMAWEPDDMAWAAFIKFEMRQGQIERARAVYERYVALLPTCRAYLKYAHWEEKNHQRGLTRRVYERSLVELHPHERTEKLLINFARFEERCKEYERARVVYQYALGQVENNDSVSGNKEEEVSELKKEFVAFEKRHGDKASIDVVIVSQRREKYEELLRIDRFDYDTWFDYIRLEEAEQDADRVRAVYTRAVASVPPVLEKRYWRRYVYLWINYALFEELTERDLSRARAVYKACLDVIPHRVFTFGKMWLLAAQLEVRVKDLAAARRILGQGIGMCGKENIFKGYIELELQLGEVDRCRTLYSKYIEKMPFNCAAWKAFAQLETNCGETARARAIYELAVAQSDLDMPETLWRAYMDFEAAEGELAAVRGLYERLLFKSNHVKVWIAYGQFEAEVATPAGASDAAVTRAVFSKGYDTLKRQGLKEERVLLLEAWRDAEGRHVQLQQEEADAVSPENDERAPVSKEFLLAVEAKFPRKIKMKRLMASGGSEDPLAETDGSSDVFEEYYDYIFPDDEKKIAGMGILEKAMAWKKAAAAAAETAAANASAASSTGEARGDESIDIDGEEEQQQQEEEQEVFEQPVDFAPSANSSSDSRKRKAGDEAERDE